MIKRVAFVDFELDNWHTNTFLTIYRKELKKSGFAPVSCHAINEKTGREWAKKNGLNYYSDLKELNRNTDYYMVMAPSNPEKHIELCRKVFPFGKPTFVDKTFAPNAATAAKIFALAARYGVRMQTCSALRHTDIQKYVAEVGRKHVRHVAVWGGGGSFGEYAVHPLEIAVSCMGPNATTLMRRRDGHMSQLVIGFSGNRTAIVNVCCRTNTPFAAAVTTDKETRFITVDGGKLFIDAAWAVVHFFKARKPLVPRAESMTIMRLIDASHKPKALKGFVRV